MKRPKIAYVTIYDATKIANWSGTGYFIGATLQKHVGDVTWIGNLEHRKFIGGRLQQMFHRLTDRKEYHTERTRKTGVHFAKQVEKELRDGNFDLVFAAGTIPVAYLNLTVPLITYTDATFASMVGYYFKNLCAASIADGNRMEAMALRKASKLLYASSWAANSAIRDYGIEQGNVHVVPFGANIRQAPQRESLKRGLSDPMNFLFIGKEWDRKGGTIAYEVVRLLQKRHVNALLHIVGCTPSGLETDPLVRIYGFLDKNNPDQWLQLTRLFSGADFFLVPSREECFGVVFCEANAYGIPVLTHNTGGTSSIVVPGENGFLSRSNTAEEYVDFVTSTTESGKYETLRQEARLAYETRLNWDAAGKQIRTIVEGLLS